MALFLFRRPHFVCTVFALALGGGTPFGNLHADTPSPLIGAHFPALTAGKKNYQEVVVRQVTPRSVTIVHAGGMTSIPLRDLSPEMQARFGYSPEAERAADEKLAAARRESEARRSKAKKTPGGHRGDELANTFELLLQSFGTPPTLETEVDLRPKFLSLSLSVKDQGRRPSCAIFAVVSALEFQNAQLSGSAEKLSEEYLIWATRRTTQHVGSAAAVAADTGVDADQVDQRDAGFTLPEVVAALRAFGIPLQSAMPNTFGSKMEAIQEPSAGVVEQARSRRRVYVHLLPGRDEATRISNAVQALNAGVPVALGVRWPHYRTIRTGYLSEQKPILDYAHAVTLVGYRCETGRLEDAVFLFKNSYGVAWGEGGYGRMTFGYLRNYLLDAVVLEVKRGDA